MPRERSATLKASTKLTVRFSTPVSAMPATHHQITGSPSAVQPSAPTAAATWPVDSVTCRTSIGRPKKPSSGGARPSIMPSDTFAASPDTLARHQAAQRRARAAPRRAMMRGFHAIALSRRWNTNQFSVQPAISELANSSTPVKAANSAVAPIGLSACFTCAASSVPTSGAPNSAVQPSCTPSTSGAHSARLPKIPAACDRMSCAMRSTKTSICASPSFAPLAASGIAARYSASAGAVIAGCLVATVQCSSMISTKLAA